MIFKSQYKIVVVRLIASNAVAIAGSSTDLVEPKTLNLVFVAYIVTRVIKDQ